ncbi:CLUMA_CG008682, isoform A [Clunio marinus]|uniref:CLUMA_CG008682, isoform A n=1 Tax=Clunio marinus TaxID=568069 RepID=A0A1J1I6R7_9DIPT|nr:CLUMA_CG008682, isoform A [Clunio marinus]
MMVNCQSTKIEFYKARSHSAHNFDVALEFNIEQRRLYSFKIPFQTDKDISLIEWELIMRKINEFAAKRYEGLSTSSSSSCFRTGSLEILLKIIPKNKSFIRFDKLPFEYLLSWMIKVVIKRIRRKKSKLKKIQKESNLDSDVNDDSSISIDNNLNQPVILSNSSQEKELSTVNIEENEDEEEIFIQNPKDEMENNILGFDIEQLAKKSKTVHFSEDTSFTDMSFTDNHSPKTIRRSPRNKKESTRPNKKLKTDPSQRLMFAYVESPKEKVPTKSKPSTSNTLDFNDEEFEEVQKFIEKSQQREHENNLKKIELKDLEMLDCNEFSTEQLKLAVKKFKPQLEKLYNMSRSERKNLNYNPVLITTSNVLSENQMMTVIRELEKLANMEGLETIDEILTDLVLPEFIINIFKEKFDYTRSKALERLKLQDDHRFFYEEVSL